MLKRFCIRIIGESCLLYHDYNKMDTDGIRKEMAKVDWHVLN